MTLPECLTSAEIFTSTIFSVKLLHDCISLIGVIDLPYRQSNDFLPILTPWYLLACALPEKVYTFSKTLLDSKGKTPLHEAAGEGRHEIVVYLMENLDDFAPRDDEGMTPLHYAAQGGHLEVCKTLLEKVRPWMIALCIILCKHTFLDLSKYLGMIKRPSSRVEMYRKQ